MGLVPDALRFTLEGHSCPVRLPWFRGYDQGSAAGRFRGFALAARAADADARSRGAWVFRPLVGLLWPLVSAVDAALVNVRAGAANQRAHDVGRVRQFLAAWWLANTVNRSARRYYLSESIDRANAFDPLDFLDDWEVRGIQKALVRVPLADVDHKPTFYARISAAGLRVPATIARYAAGARVSPAGTPDFASGVAIKRESGHSGQGFERWVRTADGYERRDALLTAAEVDQHAAALSRAHEYVAQELIANHPEIAPLSQGALCTVRVVTYRMPDGESGLLEAHLRMPVGAAEVDNISRGGIASIVDGDTGRLGVAVRDHLHPTHYDHHPTTGAAITGRVVPRWGEIVESAILAHGAYPHFPTLGFDVGVSAEGPVMIEANTFWGHDPRSPMALSALPAVVDAWRAHLA